MTLCIVVTGFETAGTPETPSFGMKDSLVIMMTRRGKRRDYCCHGHNPKELDHGTERAREKREWNRDAAQDLVDTEPTPAPEHPSP
jgi:hypothetical protein